MRRLMVINGLWLLLHAALWLVRVRVRLSIRHLHRHRLATVRWHLVACLFCWIVSSDARRVRIGG